MLENGRSSELNLELRNLDIEQYVGGYCRCREDSIDVLKNSFE